MGADLCLLVRQVQHAAARHVVPTPRTAAPGHAEVGISAAVTWALRALPFAALARLRASRTITYLSTVMPAGVMVILAAYCLRDLPQAPPHRLLAVLLALAATIGLHLWRRNTLLNILGGTASTLSWPVRCLPADGSLRPIPN
ncbi:AzlD domain-containing protein [Dactylosporangium sp. NPDC006015]|uniref:branched-chain amino acid transporter permease n=1 Tax=Dactylosporangium sp. NPDC006015 TaxID=3154576 RepID=UPI0033B808C9